MSSLRSRIKARTSAPRLRSWAVIIIRNHSDLLGLVEAPDHPKAAEIAAVRTYGLTPEQRKRLALRERL